jgi:O-antigen/teichoic acid export membrane protein
LNYQEHKGGGTLTNTLQERQSVVGELQTAVRHTLVYGLGNALAKALGFFMLPFYTRYLNPVDYGVLEILDLSMSLFGMFLTMGMTAAVLRCYAAAESQEEKRKVISTALVFVLVTGFITFFVGLALIRPISGMLFGPAVPAKYLLVSFSSFICTYIVILPRTYLRALESSGTFTLVDNSGLCVMLGLNIYFIAVLKIGLVGILLSALIVGTLQLVLLTMWAVRRVGIHLSFPWLTRMLRFGAPLMFSNLAMFTLNFSDRFFLQHFRTLEVVGVYAVGYKFGYMVNYLVVQPFYVMWQARMYAVHDQPNHPKILRQIFVLYSLLLIGFGLALSTLSPEIVHVMVGSRFSASQAVIPIVVLAYVCWGIGFCAQTGMFLTNNTKKIALVAAAAAVLNLGLNYILVLHYGMMGAAWATLLSFMALAVGSHFLSQRVFPLAWGSGRVTIAMMTAIILYGLSRWPHYSSFKTAVLVKVFLIAMFPILLWTMRILSPAEVATIVEVRDRLLAKMYWLAGMLWRKEARAQ